MLDGLLMNDERWAVQGEHLNAMFVSVMASILDSSRIAHACRMSLMYLVPQLIKSEENRHILATTVRFEGQLAASRTVHGSMISKLNVHVLLLILERLHVCA